MNTPQLPSVELIQGSPAPAPEPRGPARWRRWKVFFSVLLISAVVGLAIVYGRDPIYRASASVLTVKPKAVDRRSAEADVEHVAIQGRLLLGEDLVGRLAQRLVAEGEQLPGSVDDLRASLDVVAVPDTNLLELRADGADPAQLQRIVNSWAESYEGFRAEEIEAATGRTTAEIEDQQAQLQTKIEEARAELADFRQRNEIVGLERGENRALASLAGLNDSLNKARDRLISALARKEAVDEAITRGETVVPSEQKAEIAKMKLAVQRGKARLEELRKKYTQAYLNRDPNLKELPDNIRALESELDVALQIAKVTVRDEAQQDIEAARVSLKTVETKLAEQQLAVQQFNEHYKEFRVLEENLARLDRLHANNKERLAEIQVKNLKKFPPIQIVEWARLPTRPIYPDYERDLMIALGAALTLALFVTWLVEYLSEKAKPTQAQPYLGVRIITGDAQQAISAGPGTQRLDHAPGTAAPHARLQSPPPGLPVLPRELAGAEVQSLLAACDPTVNAYAGLLLSGVSPYELPLLHSDCFDRGGGVLRVPGASDRSLAIGAGVWQRIAGLLGEMDKARMPLSVAELDQRLAAAAGQSQLADPGNINALSLWHTYVVFLVRQGIDASALVQRVGGIPSELLGTLMHYAPPGGTRALDSIEFTYPALAY